MAQWSRVLTLNYRSLIPVYLSLSEVIGEKATVCSQNAKGFPAGVECFLPIKLIGRLETGDVCSVKPKGIK